MSPFLNSIIERYYPASGTELHVGRVPVSRVLDTFGAPLYVYDGNLLVDWVRVIKNKLGPRVDLLFAVKANPSVAVVQLLCRQGVGAEIASAGELVAARKAGIDSQNVHFAGPGKTDEDLRYAIDAGIASINVESRAELERIVALTRQLGRSANVSFRIRFDDRGAAARMRMAGGDQKFGLAPDAVPDLLALLKGRLDAPRFVGLHTYAGTQCFDAGGWLEQARRLLALANDLETQHDVRVGSVNFGGGFGFGYFEGDPTFDLERLGDELQRMLLADAADHRRYLIELGRYVVAPAGTYLARVTYVKVSGSRHHLVLDGGLHHHAGAAGIGSVIKRPFPIVNATRLRGNPSMVYSVGGSLCTPADEFCRDYEFPATTQGDCVAVLNSGAYGYTFSQLEFLSHKRPAEIMVLGDEMHLIREATTPEGVLVGQHGLPY